MDKRKTQRILGILVIIALVIILFPLIFSKNETATPSMNEAQERAPAFPNQPAVPPTTTNTANQDLTNPATQSLPTDTGSEDTTTEAKQEIGPAADTIPVTESNSTTTVAANTPPVTNTPSNSTTDALFSPTDSQTISSTEEHQETPINQAKTDINQTEDNTKQAVESSINSTSHEDTTSQPAPQPPITKKQPLKSTKIKTPHPKIARNNMTDLNKSAWVVQMGSFRSKENARKLTNRLRSAGFNAFTKEVRSAHGSISTRVYIGPEFKKTTATKIALKVKHDMNLQSIVLPYKPLAL